jgi:adenosylcobalamin-dependent ribonucleoside-triphosphate reductase
VGISQTGIIDAINKHGLNTIINWSDNGYKHLQKFDTQLSNWLCIPKSIKITTVKPSGTVSLLPGVTSGIHYPHAQYYIRRIRFDETSEYVPILKEAGYKVEKDSYSNRTYVIEFPIKEKFFTKGKNDVSIWEQFENVAIYQKYWADNMVSCTITFNKDEEKDIKSALDRYQYKIKSCSLLPIKDHGYKQAPYEEITKEQYEEMTKDLKKYNLNKIGQKAVGTKGCDGDSCSII